MVRSIPDRLLQLGGDLHHILAVDHDGSAGQIQWRRTDREDDGPQARSGVPGVPGPHELLLPAAAQEASRHRNSFMSGPVHSLADLLASLDLKQTSDRSFTGQDAHIGLPRVYGGQVIGQSLIAAGRTIAAD